MGRIQSFSPAVRNAHNGDKDLQQKIFPEKPHLPGSFLDCFSRRTWASSLFPTFRPPGPPRAQGDPRALEEVRRVGAESQTDLGADLPLITCYPCDPGQIT